jgi:hypothetical protein
MVALDLKDHKDLQVLQDLKDLRVLLALKGLLVLLVHPIVTTKH